MHIFKKLFMHIYIGVRYIKVLQTFKTVFSSKPQIFLRSPAAVHKDEYDCFAKWLSNTYCEDAAQHLLSTRLLTSQLLLSLHISADLQDPLIQSNR